MKIDPETEISKIIDESGENCAFLCSCHFLFKVYDGIMNL